MVNKKKGGLSKRYQASFDTKESRGGSKNGVMDWRKVDGEVNFFKPVEGKNRINIIPYVIKTKNHPLVKRGEFEIGDTDYVMDCWVHRSVGLSEVSVVCLKETYGKPCPICEQSAMFAKEGKDKEAKDLKPKRRVIYNIQDLKEPDKLKVFEASHNLFEKELIDEARDDEEGGFVDFADVVVADGRGVRDLQFVDKAGDHGNGFVQLVAGGFAHAVVAADLVQFDELLLLVIDLGLEGLATSLDALKLELEIVVFRLGEGADGGQCKDHGKKNPFHILQV